MGVSVVKIEKKDLLKAFTEKNEELMELILAIEVDAVNPEATIDSITAELQDESEKSFFQYEDDGVSIEAEDIADFLEEQAIPHSIRIIASDSEIEDGYNVKHGDLMSEFVFDGKTKTVVVNNY